MKRMLRYTPLYLRALLALTVLLLTGCSALSPYSSVTKLDLGLSASDQVNLDLNGRPSPLVIRLMELKHPVAFHVIFCLRTARFRVKARMYDTAVCFAGAFRNIRPPFDQGDGGVVCAQFTRHRAADHTAADDEYVPNQHDPSKRANARKIQQ